MTRAVLALVAAIFLGCNRNSELPTGDNQQSDIARTTMSHEEPLHPPDTKIEPRNEFGFAKAFYRKDDVYYEGVVDANGDEIVPLSNRLIVNDIAGKLALIQFERKFLFVPLEGGAVTVDDLASVNGFQYAEPHRCGLAMVCVDDLWFYINSDYQKAFEDEFEFAESFHQNRALVKSEGKYRIIDTNGKPVADLNYDQVSLQSPWCWQVINKVDGKYKSGFVDLDGKQITDLIFDNVGYYDPEAKRIRVSKEDHFGFVDEHAKLVIPVIYEYARPFDRGTARVTLDGRTFFIDPDGNEVPERS